MLVGVFMYINLTCFFDRQKLKRKSNNDGPLVAAKTSRTDEANAEYVYNFSEPVCTGIQDHTFKKNSPQNATRNAENFSGHQFHSNLSLNISVDAGMNHPQSEIKLRFSCASVNAKPDAAAQPSMSFDNVDFCKKEPHDDSQGPSAVDDTQDLINFDEDGLCDFLDGIEELPADIFQVLNQGELDNMDFHDSPLNIKDSVSDTAPDQPISSASSVPSVLLHTNSSNGEFKASSTSNDSKGPSPPNQFSNSASGSQISLNVEIAQSLVTDAGPAAETLKQMAARRSQETSTKASSYTQNQQQTPSQTYSYTIPYPVSDYASSTSMATGQNLAQQRYRMPLTLNSTSPQLSALQSCLPGKHEHQNAYCPPYGAGSGFGIKQSRSRIRSACASSLSPVRYPGIGNDVSLQFCVRSQSSQMENPAQFSIMQNQQTLVPSNDANNHFNPGHLSISTTQQQQFFYQPVQNSSTTNVVRPYSQTTNRNMTVNPHPGQQHLSTYPALQYVSTASRIQAGGQMFVNKNMMKVQSNASQQLELPLTSTIKMEVGMTGCSSTNGQAFSDAIANNTSLPPFRNNTSQSDYLSQGYTQPGVGVFGNLPNPPNFMRSSAPLYLKSSSNRTSVSNNAANSNVFLHHGSQLGSWLQASLQSPSLGMEPSLNAVPPHRSPQFTEYRQLKPPTPQTASVIHGDAQHQQHHAPKLAMRGWGYSEVRMPQGYPQLGNDIAHLSSDGTQTNVGQVRLNTSICGSSMLLAHSGQRSGVVTMQGQLAGNGHRPSVGQSSSAAGQFMFCNDTSALFDSSTIQNHESIELSLIEDFINGK